MFSTSSVRFLILALVITAFVVLSLAACNSSSGTNYYQDENGNEIEIRSVDPTPERLDGTSSQEFEQEDIDAANGASKAVQNYCSGAVSEAQQTGCEAHVTIP